MSALADLLVIFVFSALVEMKGAVDLLHSNTVFLPSLFPNQVHVHACVHTCEIPPKSLRGLSVQVTKVSYSR